MNKRADLRFRTRSHTHTRAWVCLIEGVLSRSRSKYPKGSRPLDPGHPPLVSKQDRQTCARVCSLFRVLSYMAVFFCFFFVFNYGEYFGICC